jgi:hypothetical protein
MDALFVRRSTDDDIGHIKNLVGNDTDTYRQRYGDYKLSYLVENSLLAVTLVECGTSRVMGFAAFADSPPSQYTAEWYKWAARFPTAASYKPLNSIWLDFYVADPLFEMDGLQLALSTAFETLHTADYALYQINKDTAPFMPLRHLFKVEEMNSAKVDKAVSFQVR